MISGSQANLGVIVGVRIDKTGSHDQVGGIHDLLGSVRNLANFGNFFHWLPQYRPGSVLRRFHPQRSVFDDEIV